MFSWGKKNNKSQEPPKANTDDLNYYFSVITGTDPSGNTVKKGDYVELKAHPCLPLKYAGCTIDLAAAVSDNVYGYVLERSDVDEEASHTALGNGSDLLIATNQGGIIKIHQCDSRMFQTIPEDIVNKVVTTVLKEFVDDAPIVSPVVGKLVRLRAHCEIGCGSKSFKMTSFSSSSQETFLAPFIVLTINDKRLTLGGVSVKDGLIHETLTYTNLVCAV